LDEVLYIHVYVSLHELPCSYWGSIKTDDIIYKLIIKETSDKYCKN